MRFPEVTTAISIKTILLATDFTEASELAAEYAVILARHFEAKLITTHVLAPMEYLYVAPDTGPFVFNQIETLAKREMKEFAERLTKVKLDHVEKLKSGDIWESISETVQDEHVDLIILGSHGRMGVGKLLMGSVSEEVMRQARCPILVVRPHGINGTKGEMKIGGDGSGQVWRRILHASDFSPGSVIAAKRAATLAEECDAELTLLHVMKPPDPDATKAHDQAEMTGAYNRLSGLLSTSEAAQAKVSVLVESGDAQKVILKVAQEWSADLIVIGLHESSRDIRLASHFSTVAHDVIASAPCPVLLLHQSERYK